MARWQAAGVSTSGTKGYGIVLDGAYVTGNTISLDFPTTANAFQRTGKTNKYMGGVVDVAFVSNGNWKAAIEALTKSMELSKGGDSTDWFFLAMAHWQLGDKPQARSWYDKAVPWMEKNQPKDEELIRFRAGGRGLAGSEREEGLIRGRAGTPGQDRIEVPVVPVWPGPAAPPESVKTQSGG